MKPIIPEKLVLHLDENIRAELERTINALENADMKHFSEYEPDAQEGAIIAKQLVVRPIDFARDAAARKRCDGLAAVLGEMAVTGLIGAHYGAVRADQVRRELDEDGNTPEEEAERLSAEAKKAAVEQIIKYREDWQRKDNKDSVFAVPLIRETLNAFAVVCGRYLWQTATQSGGDRYELRCEGEEAIQVNLSDWAVAEDGKWELGADWEFVDEGTFHRLYERDTRATCSECGGKFRATKENRFGTGNFICDDCGRGIADREGAGQ